MRVSLNTQARAGISAFFANQAELNGISASAVGEGMSFSIVPKVEYRWVKGIQSAHEFLKRITMDTCDEMIVNDLGYESGGIVSGRTDTDSKDRQTKSLGSVKGVEYKCVVVDHDTHIKFSDLNRWSERDRQKFLEFINERRRASKANDIVMIGWHGTSVAVNTDATKNPLGQDVNKGWIQHTRENKPENLLTDAITIGKGGDYANLDAFAIALEAQIPTQKRKDLVCLASADLVDVRTMGLAESSDVTEIAGKKVRLAQNFLANGTEVISPDFFPENTVIITRLENLHHLTKKGSSTLDPVTNSKRSRLELYNQSLETYALGDFEQIIIATNVKPYVAAEKPAIDDK